MSSGPYLKEFPVAKVLMAMSGGVSTSERNFDRKLGEPFSPESVVVLQESLAADPSRKFQIFYASAANQELLEPLRQEYPDQVLLIRVP